MDINKAKSVVLDAIREALEDKGEDIKKQITADMQLIGGESILDSMNLVQVCIYLEDYADENGFEFDWASEAALSKSKSMFRSVSSLAEELVSQSNLS